MQSIGSDADAEADSLLVLRSKATRMHMKSFKLLPFTTLAVSKKYVESDSEVDCSRRVPQEIGFIRKLASNGGTRSCMTPIGWHLRSLLE